VGGYGENFYTKTSLAIGISLGTAMSRFNTARIQLRCCLAGTLESIMTDLIENDAVREWLGAYLDGELNAERRAWVEYHLARCAMCRHELEELRKLSSRLHADPLPVSECSADQFLERVLERLPEAIKCPPPPASSVSPAGAIAPQGMRIGHREYNLNRAPNSLCGILWDKLRRWILDMS
jgi:hypothetical protein